MELYDWVTNNGNGNNHHQCRKKNDTNRETCRLSLLDILPSPCVTEYRNKVEASFGWDGTDRSTARPIVGCMPQGWGGPTYPLDALCPVLVPRAAVVITSLLSEFLSLSELSEQMPPYDTRTHTGIWRYLTLRFNRRHECMVVIVHAPPTGGAGGGPDVSDQWPTVQQQLVDRLTRQPLTWKHDNNDDTDDDTDDDKESYVKVTSVFFQEYAGLSNPKPEDPVQHWYGQHCIEETLNISDNNNNNSNNSTTTSSKFQISPGAFFQVNTLGAEVLYGRVVEAVREAASTLTTTTTAATATATAATATTKKPLLLDVCCGTGTIGLVCWKAGVCSQVLGIDISEPSIHNARQNAALNGAIHNSNTTNNDDNTTINNDDDTTIKFIANRAEAVLEEELHQLPKDVPVVAVVDPPRSGLHHSVLRALRAHEAIRRIVYVSCNPTGTLVPDTTLLCGPPTKKYQGRPFRPLTAQPVDMFPSTPHCEMILVLERE